MKDEIEIERLNGLDIDIEPKGGILNDTSGHTKEKREEDKVKINNDGKDRTISRSKF